MNDYVQYLLDYKHRFSKAQLAKLSREDIKNLYKLFTSGKAAPFEKKILQILTGAAPDIIRKDLETIVADDKRPEALRLQAVAALNAIFDNKTEGVYQQLLRRQELPPLLQLKLIKGLGIFGTAESWELLSEIERTPRLENALQLTKLLVAARQGRSFLLDPALVPPRPFPDKQRTEIQPVVREAPALDPKDRYRIEARKKAYYYECGRAQYAILPNQLFNINNRKHPQIAALLAGKSRYGDAFFTRLLVFLMPRREGPDHLLVYRTDGLLCYGGPREKGDRFTLISQKNFAGDQVYLRGSWEKGQLHFEEFSSAPQMKNKKKPSPLSF